MTAWPCLFMGAVGLALASASGAVPVQAAMDDVLAGRALYRGETSFATAPQLQGVSLPSAACVQCHGLRGEARSEAGVSVPTIQWRPLMQPREALAAYEGANQVAQAIEQGLGRQGNQLQAPMPQFQMTSQESRAMLAYLRAMATDAEPVPGVTAQRVVVASVLPLHGVQAGTGERIHAAMTARFAAINAAGGIFGRHIELRVIDGGETAVTASAAARAVLQDPGSDIFALVGSLLPNPDDELLQLLKRRDIPMVATLGVTQSEPTLHQLTYLLPSLETQVRQLAAEMARRCVPGSSEALLLHPPRAPLQVAVRQALPAWQLQPVSDVSQWVEPRQVASDGRVIALLGHDQVAQLREHWEASPAPACLGTLAVLSGRPPSGGPSRFAEAVALPMPPVLLDKAQPAGATLWPLLGDTAARVFAEAIARSGRVLDTERFGQALDTLHHFQPGPGLSVTFGPQQRHGFDVSYFWRENAHETPHPIQ